MVGQGTVTGGRIWQPSAALFRVRSNGSNYLSGALTLLVRN